MCGVAGKKERTPEAIAFGKRLEAARLAAGYPTTESLSQALIVEKAKHSSRRWLAGVENGENSGIDFDAIMELKGVLPEANFDALIAGDRDAETPFLAEMRIVGARLDPEGLCLKSPE